MNDKPKITLDEMERDLNATFIAPLPAWSEEG